MTGPTPKLDFKPHDCGHLADTRALLADELLGAQKRAAQRHLESCRYCRTYFHDHANWLPKLEDYTLLEQLGRGGFGAVYRAIHHTKQRAEAVKILWRDTTLRTAYFENEVHLVARLQHPNIVTLHEAHLKSSPMYYAMELVDGQQLDPYLTEHEVTIEKRLKMLRSILAAVHYAHTQGVVHRDLKPQNVLVDSWGRVRVVDFGVARWLAPRSDADEDADRNDDTPAARTIAERESTVGTRGYMAPEQRAGNAVDPRSDIYSLGVLLFHMVTGRRGLDLCHGAQLRELVIAQQVNRPQDLVDIIERCVALDPDQRYPDVPALDADLERYLRCQPVWSRRKPTLGGAAVQLMGSVLRDSPLALRLSVCALLAVALTGLFAGTHLSYAVDDSPRAATSVLLTIDEATIAALRANQVPEQDPRISVDERLSLRRFYAQLLEHVDAHNPSVVVWDYYFPRSAPEHDVIFAAAIERAQAPVIVGVDRIDEFGEPRLCAALREVVDGYGMLSSPSQASATRRTLTFAAQAAQNPYWRPSLSVRAMTALRAPEAEPFFTLAQDRLEVRYRTRGPQQHWLAKRDALPVVDVVVDAPLPFVGALTGNASGPLNATQYALGNLPLREGRFDPQRSRSAIEFLRAAPEEREAFVAGRVVVIGQQLPGIDQLTAGSGEQYWGCEIHPAAIDVLAGTIQGNTLLVPLPTADIASRVVLWGVLAALIVRLIPVARRPRRGGALLLTTALLASGFGLAAYAGLRLSTPWVIEGCVAIATLGIVGGPLRLIAILRQRLRHPAPWPVRETRISTVDRTTLALDDFTALRSVPSTAAADQSR